MFALVLFAFLITIVSIDYRLQMKASITFEMLPHMIFDFVVYPLVGTIVGSLYIIRERKKSGKWKFNLGKFLIIALPAFYLAYYPFLVYFSGPLQFLEIPSPFFNKVMIDVQSTMLVFQFVFGYILVASFHKEDLNSS